LLLGFTVFLLFLAGSRSSGLASSFDVTIETDRHSYQPGEDFWIGGRLTYGGGALQSRLVVVWVENPDGSTYYSPTTRQTDSDGRYNLSGKLSSQTQLGTYMARVNYACPTGGTLTNSTTIEVVSVPTLVVPEPSVMASVVLMSGALSLFWFLRQKGKTSP